MDWSSVGTFSDWASVIVSIGAVAAAFAATRVARRTLQLEEDRDQRSHAEGIAAWWVQLEPGGFDIQLRNSRPLPFYDVTIWAHGNNHPRGQREIKMTTVPPGDYFVPSNPRGSDRPWGYRQNLPVNATVKAITSSDEYRVVKLQFKDAAYRSWEWSIGEGYLKR